MQLIRLIDFQDGVLTAKIDTPLDTYHIEPSWRHLDTNDTSQMIAYRESDIMFSWNQPDSQQFKPTKVKRNTWAKLYLCTV